MCSAKHEGNEHPLPTFASGTLITFIPFNYSLIVRRDR